MGKSAVLIIVCIFVALLVQAAAVQSSRYDSTSHSRYNNNDYSNSNLQGYSVGYSTNGYNVNGYDIQSSANEYDIQGDGSNGYDLLESDTNNYDSSGYDTNSYSSSGYQHRKIFTDHNANENYNTNYNSNQNYNDNYNTNQNYNTNYNTNKNYNYNTNQNSNQNYNENYNTNQNYNSNHNGIYNNGYNGSGHYRQRYNNDRNNNKEYGAQGYKDIPEYETNVYQQQELTSSQETNQYLFSALTDKEPYYSEFCDKINPYDSSVRQAVANAIKNDAGLYSFNQLFDIFDWVKNNIEYQGVELAGIPFHASTTLSDGSGDSKNQAVLIASMVGAIGKTAKVVADNSCNHAYTIVKFGSNDNQNINSFNQAVSSHYGTNRVINYFVYNNSIWVIFDPAGGVYPGNILSTCLDTDTKYVIDSCMSCSVQEPTQQYTFNNSCYSQCPSGTISKNNYSCTSCPAGYYSYNNDCLTCPLGYSPDANGICKQE